MFSVNNRNILLPSVTLIHITEIASTWMVLAEHCLYAWSLFSFAFHEISEQVLPALMNPHHYVLQQWPTASNMYDFKPCWRIRVTGCVAWTRTLCLRTCPQRPHVQTCTGEGAIEADGCPWCTAVLYSDLQCWTNVQHVTIFFPCFFLQPLSVELWWMPRRGADHREKAAVGNVPAQDNTVRDVWECPSNDGWFWGRWDMGCSECVTCAPNSAEGRCCAK